MYHCIHAHVFTYVSIIANIEANLESFGISLECKAFVYIRMLNYKKGYTKLHTKTYREQIQHLKLIVIVNQRANRQS